MASRGHTPLAAPFADVGIADTSDAVSDMLLERACPFTVLVVGTEHKDEFTVTLIEVTNPEVLKTVHGDDNVSGSLATGLTVRVNSDELPESVWVVDMILHGVMKRVVIPKGKVTEVGEVSYKDDDAVGYELTITAMSGGFADDDTHKEYLKSIAEG